MSWLYGISIIGFVSTTLRAAVAAVQYAVLGVPEPDVRRAAGGADAHEPARPVPADHRCCW